MIAGIAHVTMEAELPGSLALADAMGFKLEFHDTVALPASFENVSPDAQRLPLALCAGDRGIRLEIVDHGVRTTRRGIHHAILHGDPPVASGPAEPEPRLRDLLRRAGVAPDPRAVTPAAGVTCWFDGSAGAGVAGLLCRVPDVPAEAGFWSRLLGFSWAGEDSGAAWARVSAPLLRTRYHLVLAQTDEPYTRPEMNDLGFPSLGVYSTSMEADCARAVSAGATLRAEPIQTEVGGKPVRMALLETPNGGLVELLSVGRRDSAR
jgi:glyoxalase superfamily protein